MTAYLRSLASNLMDEVNRDGHQVTIKAGRHTLAVRWAKGAPLAARLQLDADICRALGIKPRKRLGTEPPPKKRRAKKQRRTATPPPSGGAAA
jgi:hypothetical protein